MASYTALNTAFSGMNVHARNLDVIGNNIANSNTTAFKSSRMLFEPAFYRTLSLGSEPVDSHGGTNPTQIGLGAIVAGTQQNFNQGAISQTGDARDLAIDGRGFFPVRRGVDQFYTRNGAFRQDAEGKLVTLDGDRVQGYGIDDNFNIVSGVLGDLDIPVGSLQIAQATRTVRFGGNLDADGVVATRGSLLEFGGTTTTGLRVIGGASVPPPPGSTLAANSLLREIEDPLAAGSGTPLFGVGQSIELRGMEKGGRVVPDAKLDIDAGTTVQNLMDFFSRVLGLRTDAGANPDGGQPGLRVDGPGGKVVLTGNTGASNDVSIDLGDVRLLGTDGKLVRSPFAVNKTQAADGESVRTAFTVYDSLGSPSKIDAAMTLVSRGPAGTVWRYDLDRFELNPATSPRIATGELLFNEFGGLESTEPIAITLDQTAGGAASPQVVQLEFGASESDGGVTALADEESELAANYQDGSPIGTLASFGTDEDGVIVGTFTNGLSRNLGQIALATFVNEEGLVDEGDNLFRVGVNSGPASIVVPGELGTGQIASGSLEASNTDLGSEFIKMIQMSTGYSANARVVRTTDELMQQLLTLGR